MSTFREYRKPLLIAGGALIVVIILWVALISSQTSSLSHLRAQTAQLQSQETELQARLTSLQSEGQKLSANCADLQTISTQIPSVQTPTDIDAEESSFESQFNSLAGMSGVSLAQFNGFAPASTTGSSSTSSKAGGASSSSGVTAVPTTLTVQGNYGQITAFIDGLDNFPRLFVIQSFVLAYGAASTSPTGSSTSTSSSATSGAATSAAPSSTPLWVGGTPTAASAGPYNLAITGSIYYTTTPNALSACSQATAAQATK